MCEFFCVETTEMNLNGHNDKKNEWSYIIKSDNIGSNLIMERGYVDQLVGQFWFVLIIKNCFYH